MQIQANMVGVVLNLKRLVALFHALFMVILALRAINHSNIDNRIL